MSKPITAFLFAVIFSTHVFAQQKLHLIISYQPNHTYIQKIDQKIKMNMDGMDDEKGKDKNALNDLLKKDMGMQMQASIQTGRLYKDSLFPARLKIEKMSMMGMDMNMFSDNTIYATASIRGRFKVDSVSGSQDLSDKLMESYTKMFDGVSVKEHTLRVGESFTEEKNMNQPSAGLDVSALEKTTYTLKKIENGKAYLDVAIVFDVKGDSSGQEGRTLKMNGSGGGKVVYDIRQSQITQSKMNITMEMNGNSGGKNMAMNISTDSDITEEITENH